MEEELNSEEREGTRREGITSQYESPEEVSRFRRLRPRISLIGVFLLAVVVLFLVSSGLGFALAQFGIGPLLFD